MAGQPAVPLAKRRPPLGGSGPSARQGRWSFLFTPIPAGGLLVKYSITGIFYCKNTFILGEENAENKKNITLQTFKHRQFVQLKTILYQSVQVTDGLSSIALLSGGGDIFVPHWFVNRIKAYASQNQAIVARPRLNLSEIKSIKSLFVCLKTCFNSTVFISVKE